LQVIVNKKEKISSFYFKQIFIWKNK